MNLPNQATNAIGISVGAAGYTFPWWNDFVAFAIGANQFLIQLGGLLIIAVTLLKLGLEAAIAWQKFRQPGGGK